MNVSNQELHALNMPQVIIEDSEYKDGIFQANEEARIAEMNRTTLDSMYRVQESIYKLFGQCDMQEIEANTINPAQQNIFISLKSWRINLNGCYAIVRIKQRAIEGCFAEIEIL